MLRSRRRPHARPRVAADPLTVTMLALLFAASATAQCPEGERDMCFPSEGYFQIWRYSTVSSNYATEQIWHSESRQEIVEALPLANGFLFEYFDFAGQTLTIVQTAGSTIVDCTQFPITQQYRRPCAEAGTPSCFQRRTEASFLGLLPVEQWFVTSGITVIRDVLAANVGDDLIPLRLYNRQSTTILTDFMNYRPNVEDSDFELPCVPTVIPNGADTLRELERRHGLEPGTLGRTSAEP